MLPQTNHKVNNRVLLAMTRIFFIFKHLSISVSSPVILFSSLGICSFEFDFSIGVKWIDLDGKNIGGWTPLMYAAYIGHDNIANLLLEAGVNVNARTAKGLTPLMLAASCGIESIAYFLLQV